MIWLNKSELSHIKRNRVNRFSLNRTYWIVSLAVLVWSFLIAGTAIAADAAHTAGFRKIETYKVNLADLSDISEPRLDWRNPEYDVMFEIPTSDWVEKIDFFVKIHAEGQVNKDAPIYVRFNDSNPVPVYPRGNSFEARISLDTASVKAHRNMVSISFAKQAGCIGKLDGAFSIDMDDSLLVVKASTPSRTYYLRDAKQILNSPLTSPKTVAIRAFGDDRLTYEALGAQGMALNMPTLPRFTVSNGGNSGAELLIGTRQELASYLKGTEISRREGPMIANIGNAPLRLVLTADTHTELNKLVKSFASREMPSARRTFAYAGEFSWQTPFSVKHAALSGKKPIYEMGNLRFDRGWGNSAQSITFDVDNPLAAHGTAKIRFQKSPDVSKDSSVQVQLNGESLGTVALNARQTTAKFNIPQGLLYGTENRLTISPDLVPNDTDTSCKNPQAYTGFAVDHRSYLNIKSDNSNINGDLTRLAASGFPFSSGDGEKTNVVFATTNSADRAAALRIFAQLGRAYGTGWTESQFLPYPQTETHDSMHSLFIGPKFSAQTPKELNAEIEGRLSEPKIIHTASLDPGVISLMSVRTGTPVKGGIAALYESDKGYLNGYITSARGHNFSRAMDQLVRSNHWNNLQGSVAKWNNSTVEMSKTAFKTEKAVIAEPVTVERLEKPGFKLPKIAMPELSDFAVDVAPIKTRLSQSAGETREFFADTGRGASILYSNLKNAIPKIEMPKFGNTKAPEPKIPEPTVAPKPEQPTSAIAGSDEAPKRPQASGIVFPQKTTRVVRVIPLPKPAVKPAALPEPATAKIEKVGQLRKSPQYNPGASLRGLSKVKVQPKIEPAAAPQYEQNVSYQEEVKGAAEETSNWMSRFLNKFVASPPGEPDNRKANLIIFAAAMVLLLLLLALVRPQARREY